MPEPAPLFPVVRSHLATLSDGVGILQHARGSQPDPAHGVCTDDIARALIVDLRHERELGWAAVEASAARHVASLAGAFDGRTGRFRNLRTGGGAWIEGSWSEDADARALQALAETVASTPHGRVRESAAALLERAFPTASRVRSIRPLGAVVLACEAAVRAGMTASVTSVYERAGDALWQAFEPCWTDEDWPWPDPVLTYENELPARALLVCGLRLQRPRLGEIGCTVLDWLIAVQTTADGQLSTIGNDGWWPRDGRRAQFDQQPISTTSLLLAAGDAHEATGEQRYRDAMEIAYAWFLGGNDAGAMVAEPATGACRDGIGPAGASHNRGAESTLMWHLAAERIRALRSTTAAPPTARSEVLVSG
jgi:hypothetical protein